MANSDEVRQKLLDRIDEKAASASISGLLTLAEALAWVRVPDQPHGGKFSSS